MSQWQRRLNFREQLLRRNLMRLRAVIILAFSVFMFQCTSMSVKPEKKSGFFAVKKFGTNLGKLKMFAYVPNNLDDNAPLVVAMHGCTQSAADYAEVSGWNQLADRYGFAVVYPEQTVDNNRLSCFNWFNSWDIKAGKGEVSSIKNMIDFMKNLYSLNDQKIYVTGFSAGGAMTAVLSAVYPEMISGAAIIAGVPYRAARNIVEAENTLNDGAEKTPEEWSKLVKKARPNYKGAYPKIMVMQGAVDNIVNPKNLNELVKQWTAVHGLTEKPSKTLMVHGHSRNIYENKKGKRLIESYLLKDFGHSLPVDPGKAEYQGGVEKPDSIMGSPAKDANLFSSYVIARFWGLIKKGK